MKLKKALNNPHNVPISLKKRCIRLGIFLLCLFLLNYIFVPYRYVGQSASGINVEVEEEYDVFHIWRLKVISAKDFYVDFYVKDIKVDNYTTSDSEKEILSNITDKDNFYAIIRNIPNEKIKFTKKKDLFFCWKHIKCHFDWSNQC